LLRGNRVALISFLVFWSGAWALNPPFELAATVFMFCVAVNWWIVSVLFDRRAWPVGIAFTVGTFVSGSLSAWPIEIFATSALVGFGGLALTWRARRA
jgi:hypothetical protein